MQQPLILRQPYDKSHKRGKIRGNNQSLNFVVDRASNMSYKGTDIFHRGGLFKAAKINQLPLFVEITFSNYVFYIL